MIDDKELSTPVELNAVTSKYHVPDARFGTVNDTVAPSVDPATVPHLVVGGLAVLQ